MNLSAIRSYVIRYRVSIQDLGIVLASVAVSAFVAFEVDIFENQGHLTPRQEMLELDEMLLLGGLLAVGLLLFSIRRYREQGRETRRRIAAEQHARELAFQDALTGLANRRQFDEALRVAVDAPPRTGATHALLLLDLNGFKRINDVYGHGTGDDVLVAVSYRLLSATREADLVARFGGDEFAILAQHLAGPEAASNIAWRIVQTLEEVVRIDGLQHHVGAAIGIALIPGDATSPQEALRKADVALYRAKAERRSAFRFFEEEMDSLVREREYLERELRRAVESDEIRASFVPSFDLRTRAVTGFEALPRWDHPTLGVVPPERFLPVAEETGLVHELAERLLRQAATTAVQWPSNVRLSIDAFPGQLTDPDLGRRVVGILAEIGLSPERLELEITESALVRDHEAARATFETLRVSGVKIVLDNFGTGYSNLYHLTNFKLDKIKIDRRFVERVGSDSKDVGIVKALVGLGRGLGLTVAAEGVDDAEQRAALLGSDCQEGQGGFFGDALSASGTHELVGAPDIREAA